MTRTRYGIHKQQTERGVVWKATVDLGPDPATGKRRQRRLSADTRKALEAKIGELLGAAERGEIVTQTTLTVHQYMTEWLAAVTPSLKPLTVHSYRQIIDGNLKRVLGDQRLAKLTPLHVQRAIADLEAIGIQPSTIRTHIAVLRNSIRQAISWGLITKDPTFGVTLPRVGPSCASVWDANQVRAFLDAARPTDLYPLWLLAITTGMRRGEILGLTWSNVDFDAGVITVDRARVPKPREQGGGYMETTPKTRRGNRRVGISDDLVAELRRHHKRQLEQKMRNRLTWHDGDWVFTTNDGKPLTPFLMLDRFQKIIAAAELPRIRIHDLRHTAATLMLIVGENPRVVSERLGHSTVAITLDRYTHVDQAMQRAAAERLDGLLKQQKSGGS